MCIPKILKVDSERKGDRGFSLIEIMVAIVISGLVLVGVFAFSGIARTSAADFRRDVRIQQSLEGSMEAMGQDVRLSGLGFVQLCDEIRIMDVASNRVLNPSAQTQAQIASGDVPRDGTTGEAFWVLRDGFQAHWRSENTGTTANLLGDPGKPTSAAPGNHADSFDVIHGEPGYVSAMGAFRLAATAGANQLNVGISPTGANSMVGGDAVDLAELRQLFPPGSFVLLAPDAAVADLGNESARGQCLLRQITADVTWAGNTILLPTAPASNINANYSTFVAGLGWAPNPGTVVVPLGRLTWSRYEVDYTLPARPYLVRQDIIGHLPTDPVHTPLITYPTCGINAGSGGAECQIPQIHVRGAAGSNNEEGPRTPIAPMIEDMQVAVGCDGWSAAVDSVPAPLAGYAEIGGKLGLANDLKPNTRVDEYAMSDERGTDEWLGNALTELSAPSCVFWGTGYDRAADWVAGGLASETAQTGNHKMSPQIVRITLLGKIETQRRGTNPGDASYFNMVRSIEDRDDVLPVAGAREYHTITERFQLRNVVYRPPGLL